MDTVLSSQDFEKIALIGSGLYSNVYLAKHSKTNTPCAMKILKKITDPRKINHIITEYNILSTTNHPFVSKLYCSFQTDINVYMVMHYYPGGDLFGLLGRQPCRCFNKVDVRYYSSCVLSALEYLHSQGIIYRDLKPENILLQDTGHIVLSDFNLSLYIADNHLDNTEIKTVTKPHSHDTGVWAVPRTLSKEFVGTVEYIAPEVIEGYEYGYLVDWWAFGILIYEMTYGKTPFKRLTIRSAFDAIKECHLDIPKINPAGVKVSNKIKTLLLQLIVPEPQKRLGAIGGAAVIKDDPYFKNVEFQLLRNQEPPYKPNILSPLDFQYFKRSILIKNCPQEADKLVKNIDPLWSGIGGYNVL